MLDDVGHGGDAVERGPHAVVVVFAAKDDRELVHGSHVEGFVERADVHGRLTEEAQADLVASPVPDREAEPRRERDVPADDAVTAHEPLRRVEEVHRPALTLRAPRRLAEQLRHDRGGGDAPGERLPVLAIRADDVIVVAQRGERADRHGLLADVEMAEAADLA